MSLHLKQIQIAIILLTFCCCYTFAVSNRLVFVSSSMGDDTYDGLTSRTPVKTLNHAIKLGDTILLKCGDVFYENVSLKKGRIGKYGKGAKPVLCGWKKIITPSWEMESKGIWKIALCDDDIFMGFQTTTRPRCNNIGCIYEYNKDLIHGRKVQYKNELTDDWDMWQTPHHSKNDIMPHDYDTLYLKYSGDPNSLNLELSVGVIGLSATNSVIEDIRIEGFAQCGISAGSKTIIRRCEVDAIGGMTQVNESEFVSLGNGIEYWVSDTIEDCFVEYCTISRCYDAGMSLQGWNGQAINIVFCNNFIFDCCQGWEDFLNGRTNEIFEDCYFRNNIVVNSGKTSGFNYPSNRRKFCHVLSGNNRMNREMRIYDNYFVGGNLYCAFGFQGAYRANIWSNNTCVITPGELILSNYDGTKDLLLMPQDAESAKSVISSYRELTGDDSTLFIIKSKRKVNREIKKLKRKNFRR